MAEGRDSGGSLQKDLQEDGTRKLLTLTEESHRPLKALTLPREVTNYGRSVLGPTAP